MLIFDISKTRMPWVVFAERDSTAIAAQLDAVTARGGRIHRFQAADLCDEPALVQHFVFLLDEEPTKDIVARLEHPDLLVALDDGFLTVTLNPDVWYS